MTGPAAGPLVSIVLPTRNGAGHLWQSAASCLAQTCRDLELILVDDASTDQTPAIIKSLAAADPRVAAVRNERNLRLPAALNAGFARARGRYLTWTSDDNWYEPEALEKMLAFLHSSGEQFVCCDYCIWNEMVEPPTRELIVRPPPIRLDERNDVGPCFLYSQAVREAVGDYDAQAVLAEDYDYWLRVAGRFRINRLNEPLYHYRLHPASLTAQGGLRQRFMAALVRLRHGRTTPRAELGWLGLELARAYYGRWPAALRAVGRALRLASFGRLELVGRVGRRRYTALAEAVLAEFQAGRLSLSAAAERLGGLFEGREPPKS